MLLFCLQTSRRVTMMERRTRWETSGRKSISERSVPAHVTEDSRCAYFLAPCTALLQLCFCLSILNNTTIVWYSRYTFSLMSVFVCVISASGLALWKLQKARNRDQHSTAEAGPLWRRHRQSGEFWIFFSFVFHFRTKMADLFSIALYCI